MSGHNDCLCKDCEDERKDAARYRFLRHAHDNDQVPFIGLYRYGFSQWKNQEADALVDEWMNKPAAG